MKHTVSENMFLPRYFSAHFITRNCSESSKWVPFKIYRETNTVPLVKTVGDTKHLCVCTTMDMINIHMIYKYTLGGIHKLRKCLGGGAAKLTKQLRGEGGREWGRVALTLVFYQKGT